MSMNSQVHNYKNRQKPLDESKTRYKQGYFKLPPGTEHKYIGDPNQIIYRSSLEYKWCLYCSNNPNILRWSSEPLAIKYFNPIANIKATKKEKGDITNKGTWKLSNYYVDFWIEIKRQDSDITDKIFIEIKPHAQTIQPTPPPQNAPLKAFRRYKREAETYIVNLEKWKAASTFAEQRGCKFNIITEKNLKNLRLL